MASAQQPQLEQTAFPNVNPTPQSSGADFGAQVGQAQQGFGQQLEHTGDVIADNAIKWKGLENEATAQDANIGFQTELGSLEAKYHTLDGKAASEAYPQFQADVTALRQKYLGNAQNPMVQNMLLQPLAYASSYALRNGAMYAGAQQRQWMQGSAQASITLNQGLYANGYTDPAHQGLAKNALMASVDNYADIVGLDDNSRALLKQQKLQEADDAAEKNRLAFLNGQPVYDVLHAATGQDTGPTVQVGGSSYRNQLMQTEFSGGVDTPGNTHRGPVQADDAWLQHFGGGETRDQMTIADWNAALDRETAENLPQLKSALSRPVTNADLYLAHQQGLQGAVNLLTHPDALASSVVDPQNIADNIPRDAHGNYTVDPKTVTAGQFADIYGQHFRSVDAVNAASTTGIQGGPGYSTIKAAYDGLNDEDKQKLNKDLLASANSQASAARADAEYQQKLANEARKKQTDTAVGMLQTQMLAHDADPSKPTVPLLQLFQTPLLKDQPDVQRQLLAFQNGLQRGDGDVGASAHNTSALYAKMFPPDGSQPSATMKDATAAFISTDPAVHINKGDFGWLGDQADGAKNPQDKAINGKLNDVAKVVERQIDPSFSGASGEATHSVFAGTRMLQWKQAVAQRISDMKAGGKDPSILFDPTPGNKDYVGSQGFLHPYTRTLSDLMVEDISGTEAAAPADVAAAPDGTAVGAALGAQPIAPAPTAPTQPAVSIPAELPKGTTFIGKTKDGRDVFLTPDGKKVAERLPAAADTGPAVPTGD